MIKRTKKMPFRDIPEMPPEIIDAIESGNLLLFVGAGVSKLIGYPLWSELGKKLADCAANAKLLSLSEKAVLLSGKFSPMQVVTIVCKRFDDKEIGSGVNKVIEELSIKVKEDKKTAHEIAKYLSNYNATIVTTNADTSLYEQDSLNGRILLRDFRNFEYKKHAKYSFIYLHGSVEEPSSMVFTSEQYAKAYTVDDKFGEKLKELFNFDRTILFIGYGVTEFELIRYFLKMKDGKVRRMFMLDGYLDKDTIKYEFDKEYYESLGISLLPFSREKKDYKALIKVLKKWDKEVKSKTLAGSVVKEDIIKDITSKEPFDETVDAITKMINKYE